MALSKIHLRSLVEVRELPDGNKILFLGIFENSGIHLMLFQDETDLYAHVSHANNKTEVFPLGSIHNRTRFISQGHFLFTLHHFSNCKYRNETVIEIKDYLVDRRRPPQ